MTLERRFERRDTAANWASNNPVLGDGEIGYDETNDLFVIGNGSAAWNSIPATRKFLNQAGLAALYLHVLTPTGTKTGAYSANAFELVMADASGGTFSVTLPSAPANGTLVGVANLLAAALTVAAGGTDVFNKTGGSTTQPLAMQNQVVVYQYYGGVWFGITQSIPLGQMDNRYGVHFNAIPWAPEMVCTHQTVVDGLNDMPGGISVEPGISAGGIILDSVWLRVGDSATSNSGGDLICDVYVGTKSTLGTLAVSVTLTNGSQDVIGTLGTALPVAANAVVRANFTKGSSTVAKPLHLQLRGRYAG